MPAKEVHILAKSLNAEVISEREVVINNNYNLKFVSNWLMANKLSVNVDKTNVIIFHPPQKSTSQVVKLFIANREIKEKNLLNI